MEELKATRDFNGSNKKYKYNVLDCDIGFVIETADTYEKAKKILDDFEKSDKINKIYIKNFYKIERIEVEE